MQRTGSSEAGAASGRYLAYAARRIYVAEGFTLVEEAPHESFGHHLVSQTWELTPSGERLA